MFIFISATYGFTIQTKDVHCAFLQGKPISRDVFVEPPSEMKKSGYIWKLRKAAYRLNDAAKHWYDNVVTEMRRFGCQKSIYEHALYFYRSSSSLHGISVSHVDDFLEAGDKSFQNDIVKNINNTFIIGSGNEIDFKYVGVNLSQTKDGVL